MGHTSAASSWRVRTVRDAASPTPPSSAPAPEPLQSADTWRRWTRPEPLTRGSCSAPIGRVPPPPRLASEPASTCAAAPWHAARRATSHCCRSRGEGAEKTSGLSALGEFGGGRISRERAACLPRAIVPRLEGQMTCAPGRGKGSCRRDDKQGHNARNARDGRNRRNGHAMTHATARRAGHTHADGAC